MRVSSQILSPFPWGHFAYHKERLSKSPFGLGILCSKLFRSFWVTRHFVEQFLSLYLKNRLIFLNCYMLDIFILKDLLNKTSN